MRTLSYLNFVLAAVFAACYCYQAVFALVRLLGKRRHYQARKLCRYGVLIAARNEEAVIGQLIESIWGQDYPRDLVGRVRGGGQLHRQHRPGGPGPTGPPCSSGRIKNWWERATPCAFCWSRSRRRGACYDGYFVFGRRQPAGPPVHLPDEQGVLLWGPGGDQLPELQKLRGQLDHRWVRAVVFTQRSTVRPRDVLGTSCAVSGTGFLFSQQLLEELGGWNYFLLTEDLEFTADLVARGERIAYCPDAVLYDEQPRSFAQSIRQRSRWQRGYLQVIAKRGWSMVKTMINSGSFACYDMLMSTIPAVVLTVLSILLNTVMFVVGITSARQEMGLFFASVITGAVNSYFVMFLMGAMAMATERRRIHCSKGKKALYTFTFPFFVFSFGLAMLVALFGDVTWKPIHHSVALSIGDLGGASSQELPKNRKL